MSKKNLRAVLGENRTVFVVIAVCLFLLELEIFILAATHSGTQAVIQVLGADGSVVYESDGRNLSQFDRYYFEQNFGPLETYQRRLVTREVPFPFRAWFVAAFGLPVAGVLLFAFIVRAYLAMFHGEVLKSTEGGSATGTIPTEDTGRLEKILLRISRFNIFIIGFLVLMGVFAYWVVPNLITYVGRLGLETLIRYKWFCVVLATVLLGGVAWIVYLRYLLAKQAIASRTEVEKFRLELEYAQDRPASRLLEHRAEPPPLVPWEASPPEPKGSDRRPNH
jgi:hypothetical protein